MFERVEESKMTIVQIDDFECHRCKQFVSANLDCSTGIYTCLKCLNKQNIKDEEDE